MNIAKLQQTVPAALEKIKDDEKEIYSGLSRYGRALDKVTFYSSPPPYTYLLIPIDLQSNYHLLNQRL